MSNPVPTFDRRSGDSLVQVIATKLESLHGDVGDMKLVLRELTAAVTKLAVVEERQGQASLALERAFKVIEKLETRMDALEREPKVDRALPGSVEALERTAPMQAQTSTWVNNAMWAAAAAAAMFIAKRAGLL